MDKTLVSLGSEIKSLGETADGALKFGAWLVLYGDSQNTDASNLRDYFTKNTDFDIEDGDKTTVYWNHGLDPELKRRKLGTASLHKKDAGIWMEGVLQARDEYETKIQEMIKAGKLGASSGVPSHLVERKSVGDAHEILLWPLGKDASLTHTPAEWRTSAHALKSLEEFEAEVKEWDEAKHPRSSNGRFGSGGGGSDAGKKPGGGAGGDNAKVSGDDVKAQADKNKLRDKDKEKLAKDHKDGKIKTQLDLKQAINALITGTKEAREYYDKGKELGEAVGGKKTLAEYIEASDDEQLQEDVKSLPSLDCYAVTGAARNALSSLSEQALWMIQDLMSPEYRTWESEDEGPSLESRVPTHDERMEAIRKILMDYSQIALSLVTTMSQTAESMADTKSLDSLESELPDGLAFDIHSQKVLAANGEFVERVESLADMRCVKSNRRWSAEKYELLTDAAAKFAGYSEQIKALAQAHEPRSNEAPDTETVNAEATKALANIELTRARLNGVAV